MRLLYLLVVTAVISSVAGPLPIDLVAAELEVREDGARVRLQPNRTSAMLVDLEKGVVLELSESDARHGYYRVLLPDGRGEGWIHRSLVRERAPMGAEAGPRGLRAAASRLDATSLNEEEQEFARRHLALGRPQSVHVRYRKGYVTAIDSRLRIPVWVQYKLSADELDGPGDRDESDFRPDTSLPALVQSQLPDYRGSGFDRGHMAPAGDMKRSQEVMDESFLLSNIAPQVGNGFNRHLWKYLEQAVRRWVRQRGELTIILGPVFEPGLDDIVSYEVVGENQVAVPTGFFKIVVDADSSGGVDALAFMIPNRPLFGRRYEEFLVSIDEIEASTGIDFLSQLPEQEEATLEARRPDDVWRDREPLAAAAAELAVAPVTDFSMVVVGEDGHLVNRVVLDRLAKQLREAGDTTHLILFAHGWNNSLSDAEASYAAILGEMDQIAGSPQGGGIVPEQFRPIIVGLHWPSKAWDEESGRLRSASADDDLTLAICKVLPAERSPETYLQDVLTVHELLGKQAAEVTDEEVAVAWEIFRRYSIPPEGLDEASIFDSTPRSDVSGRRPQGLLPGGSLRAMFRIFTFWQMKKRAGMVGRAGASEVLRVLMAARPDVEVHLIGHSFGCKVWLSAVSAPSPRPSRPVDSMLLLQGAISAYAFAKRVPWTQSPGGYRSALNRARVDGAIIATFSSQDTPLNWAYPLGSRLAGQTGELERAAARSRPSTFAALGAVGAIDVGPVAHLIPMEHVPRPYEFTPGLWSVDGNELIPGHNEIYSRDVAWLAWSAITSK